MPGSAVTAGLDSAARVLVPSAPLSRLARSPLRKANQRRASSLPATLCFRTTWEARSTLNLVRLVAVGRCGWPAAAAALLAGAAPAQRHSPAGPAAPQATLPLGSALPRTARVSSQSTWALASSSLRMAHLHPLRASCMLKRAPLCRRLQGAHRREAGACRRTATEPRFCARRWQKLQRLQGFLPPVRRAGHPGWRPGREAGRQRPAESARRPMPHAVRDRKDRPEGWHLDVCRC